LEILHLGAVRLRKTHNERGGFTGLAAALLGILLPVGLLAFDLFSAREQFNQLQAATDASALAAAAYLSDPGNTDSVTATQVALNYFQKNQVYQSSLSTATLNSNASTATPNVGQSFFNLVYNPTNTTVTAQSAFGFRPPLLKFFGPFALHANAIAGPGTGQLRGDVCLVVDLSGSMAYASDKKKTVRYTRKYHESQSTTTTSTSSTGTESGPTVTENTNGSTTTTTTTSSTTSEPGPPDADGNATTVNVTTFTTTTTTTTPEYVSYGEPLSPPGGDRPFIAKSLWNSTNRSIPDPGRIAFSPDPPVPGYTPVTVPDPPLLSDGSRLDVTSAPKLSIDPANTPRLYAALNGFAQHYQGLVRPPYNPHTQQRYTVQDVMVALLAEGKRGNLESAAIYASEKANASATKLVPGFQPSVGFQAEYQRLALTLCQPRHTEVEALHYFIDKTKDLNKIHWSLIGYGKDAAPQTPGSTLDLSDIGGYRFPFVPLSTDSSDDQAQQVLDAIDMATVSYGTDTPGGLEEGIRQLTGPGHTAGWPRTLILLTDGIPTKGGSGKQAQLAGQLGIKLLTIGFFEGGYACPGGPKFILKLKAKGGYLADSFKVGNCKTTLPPPDDVAAANQKVLRNVLTKLSGGAGGISLR
jgi:Flp pilus assembly protein TadG